MGGRTQWRIRSGRIFRPDFFAYICIVVKSMREMKDILKFLASLSRHNNREWFEAHRAEYMHVKALFEGFAASFIEAVAAFDPSTEGVTVRDCTYRIYRDVRFSPDKRPYKTHMGVYVAPHGKKSGYAGYYIHVQPDEDTYFLCSGLYNPTAGVVRSVREEIMTDGAAFDAAMRACGGFTPDWEGACRRMPRGWRAEDPFSDYYRLRTYEVYKRVDRDYVLDPQFLENAVAELCRTRPLNVILNRCVDYAREMGW